MIRRGIRKPNQEFDRRYEISKIQQRLEQYRLVKRRKEKLESTKSKIKNFFKFSKYNDMEGNTESTHHIMNLKDKNETYHKKMNFEIEDEVASNEELIYSTDDNMDTKNYKIIANENATAFAESKWLKYVQWLVYTLFWLTLLIIAIELQFGIVFIMFSALLVIYLNTRTGPKQKNEISAYSVFNKNCQSIEGTLKAEQFDREMRFGAGSVR